MFRHKKQEIPDIDIGTYSHIYYQSEKIAERSTGRLHVGFVDNGTGNAMPFLHSTSAEKAARAGIGIVSMVLGMIKDADEQKAVSQSRQLMQEMEERRPDLFTEFINNEHEFFLDGTIQSD